MHLVKLKWETQPSQSLKQLYYADSERVTQFELFLCTLGHKAINNKPKGSMLKIY